MKKIWQEINGFLKLLWGKFNGLGKRGKIIISGILIILILAIISGIIWRTKFFNDKPRQIYEVAVMVRNQNNSDPAEDLRTSLKAGDTIVAQKAGHGWSATEKISYLILKMNLTEEQAQKLTSPQERNLTKAEIKAEKNKRSEANKNLPKEEKERMDEEIENRKITIRAREYRINMEKYFPGFDPMILLNQGQPYMDKIYDWKIVERK